MYSRSPWRAVSARSAPSTSSSASLQACRRAIIAAMSVPAPAPACRNGRQCAPLTTETTAMGRRLMALSLGLLVILGLLALRLADPFPVRVARETSFDLFQQMRPRE